MSFKQTFCLSTNEIPFGKPTRKLMRAEVPSGKWEMGPERPASLPPTGSPVPCPPARPPLSHVRAVKRGNPASGPAALLPEEKMRTERERSPAGQESQLFRAGVSRPGESTRSLALAFCSGSGGAALA